jgi:hypothetical protein
MRTCRYCGQVGHPGAIGTHESRCGDKEDHLFWSQVNKEGEGGCWLYEGTISFEGYGYVNRGGSGPNRKQYQAHRYSWYIAKGPIPDGKFLLHRCDVRNCVNPAHLYLGDHQANAEDRQKRGRSRHRYTPQDQLLWPSLSRRFK